jgi:hypothetical protein
MLLPDRNAACKVMTERTIEDIPNSLMFFIFVYPYFENPIEP